VYSLIILVINLYIVVVVVPGDKWINAGLGKRIREDTKVFKGSMGKY